MYFIPSQVLLISLHLFFILKWSLQEDLRNSGIPVSSVVNHIFRNEHLFLYLDFSVIGNEESIINFLDYFIFTILS